MMRQFETPGPTEAHPADAAETNLDKLVRRIAASSESQSTETPQEDAWGELKAKIAASKWPYRQQ